MCVPQQMKVKKGNVSRSKQWYVKIPGLAEVLK